MLFLSLSVLALSCVFSQAGGHLSALLEGFLEGTSHVEGSLGVVVTGTLEELTESVDGVLELHELSGLAREDLGHMERLGEETLNLSGTGNGHLILFGKIVHTENGNNILKRSVVLEELLDTTSNVVMNLTNNGGVEHTGGGIEGIDSGVDTELSKGTRQHSGGIKMSESGGRGGISKIISGHVDGLDGGDGTGTGGGNTLLEGTQIGSEGGLISDSGGNTSKKGGHLGASLSETEDVVNEKEHILVLFISEVLGNGEAGETDTGSGTWGLVHLSVDKGSLGAGAIRLDDTRLDHFVVEIVSLTSTLADTSEHGETTMKFSDVVNQLHDEHGLADTSTTEKSNLSSLGVGSQKVDNLNTYIIIFISKWFDRAGQHRRKRARLVISVVGLGANRGGLGALSLVYFKFRAN